MTAAAPQSFAAWQNSLPPEKQTFAIVPAGYMASFWVVVMCKYWLTQKLPADIRLMASELLAKTGGDYIVDEMVAMIAPAGEAERELFEAAMQAKDGKDKRPGSAGYNILMNYRMFELLVAANPSVLAALKSRIPTRTSWPAPQPIKQTTVALADGPERYHINSVPTQTAGPASSYTNPEPYWNRPERERQQYAEGTPNNNPIDPFTGRSRR